MVYHVSLQSRGIWSLETFSVWALKSFVLHKFWSGWESLVWGPGPIIPSGLWFWSWPVHLLVSLMWKRINPVPVWCLVHGWCSRKAEWKILCIPWSLGLPYSKIDASQTSHTFPVSTMCSRQPNRSWASNSRGEWPPHMQHRGWGLPPLLVCFGNVIAPLWASFSSYKCYGKRMSLIRLQGEILGENME